MYKLGFKMTLPLLGIICCRRIVGDAPNHGVVERYITNTAPYMNVTPVLIPATFEVIDFKALASRLDGVLLTGSASNIYPTFYGDGEEDAVGPLDFDRDKTAMALCDAFIDAQKPVFGICRGFQELNVHFGGTLSRDLVNHHAPVEAGYNEMFDFSHEILLEKTSPLFNVYNRDRILVNSVHFQGVKRLGDGLDVYAKADDGIIEAFGGDVNGAKVNAVQWHPEWETANNQDYQSLFKYWGEVIRG